MNQPQRIALAFPRGARQETFVKGVIRFASEEGCNWSYLTPPETSALSILDLKGWPGEGVLAAINTAEESEAAQSLGVPTVNVSSVLVTPDIPTAIVDNQSVGAAAADFLMSKGYRRFAFYGLLGVQYSVDRHAGFEAALAEHGFSCAEHLDQPTFGLRDANWTLQADTLSKWLSGLSVPCAVFAVSDYRARLVLDASRLAGRRVPQDLAVVGVDNDQVACTYATPSLSSVARNDELEGYRAGGLLARLIRGKDRLDGVSTVPPVGVVARQSTAAFAVDDQRLAAALTYLHDHLSEPITVDELADHADVSRRWLEYAFREQFGETPYQYLRKQRLSLARRCLIHDPALHLYEVALRTGFTSAKQLSAAFHHEYGMAPSEWRDQSEK